MDNIVKFLLDNSRVLVMLVVLIIWIGIFGYLWKLDKKVQKLEQQD